MKKVSMALILSAGLLIGSVPASAAPAPATHSYVVKIVKVSPKGTQYVTVSSRQPKKMFIIKTREFKSVTSINGFYKGDVFRLTVTTDAKGKKTYSAKELRVVKRTK